MEYFVARGNCIGPYADNLMRPFPTLTEARAAGEASFGDYTVWYRDPDTWRPEAVDQAAPDTWDPEDPEGGL